MPYRKTIFVPGETYHVYNRSVASEQIFSNSHLLRRILQTLYYYSFRSPLIKYSVFNRLPVVQKSDYLTGLELRKLKEVRILSYCLMPNHFHFLIEEIIEGGITNFIKKVQSSYAKAYNTKFERNGALFQGRFKAVRIETDEQLLHVCRYIHLNPITSYIVRDISSLENYQWSSLPEFLHRKSYLSDIELILSFFKNTSDFKKFTYDQIEYQRTLNKIKQLIKY